MEDTIGIDVEGYLDLGDTPGCRRDAVKVEPSDAFILVGHGSFTLKNMDLYRGLAVGSR